jgi:hypothetical protein
MGRIVTFVFLIGLAVAGWFGYQKYMAPPSPAFLVYQQYAEAMAREQYDKAEGFSLGQAREAAGSFQRATAGSTVQVYGQSLSMRPPSIREIAGDVNSIKWDKQSEEKSGDGSHVVLIVTQAVCRIPPGVSTAMCKWPVDFRHEAEVQLEGEVWKVSSLKETRITP